MQKMFKRFLAFTLLMNAGILFACSGTSPNDCSTSCQACVPSCATGHPYFSYRSQSINAARDMVGWQAHINKFDMEKWYGAFYILPEYTRSFKPCRIAGYLFGQDYKDGKLTISGSRKGVTADNSATGAVARGANEWLADYFGLGYNHVSTVQFTPRIQNFLVDLGLYVGFGEKWKGGFFKIHAPITYSRWSLNAKETVETTADLDFAMGYMATTTTTPTVTTWLDAMGGNHTWGDMQEKMKYGKIDPCCCTLKKTRLSDIEMALGWNFLQDEDYHFGLMIRGSAPTGNKPDAKYLFEPIIGAGGHWMVGGGLTTHLVVWTDDQEEATFSAHLDANFGHYFNARQMRSFDLKGRPNSRYMLVQEMTDAVSGLVAGSVVGTAEAPAYQYAGNLAPLINKTTCCADVSIAVQGDMALKFCWAKNEWSFDIGYNVWGRTGETIKQDCCNKTCCLNDDDKKWVLKGDSALYGFGVGTTTATALSVSQNDADIYSGRNTKSGVAFTTADQKNPDVDKAQLAWSGTTNANLKLLFTGSAVDSSDNQTKTSYEPEILSCDDLDLCNTPRALSHKLFVHINYDNMSDDPDAWNTFFGIGGEVEFAGKADDEYSSISQWGIWVKGGVTFD